MKRTSDGMMAMMKYFSNMSNKAIAKYYDLPIAYVTQFYKDLDKLTEGYVAVLPTPEGEVFVDVLKVDKIDNNVLVCWDDNYAIPDGDVFTWISYHHTMRLRKDKLIPLGLYARDCQKKQIAQRKKEELEKKEYLKAYEKLKCARR